MTDAMREVFEALADHLSARRGAIIEAWRAASEADPDQSTASTLTRTQFIDHIPGMLDALESRFREDPSRRPENPTPEQKHQEVQHGLHRWKQGYHPGEIAREWGHLHIALHREVERFAGDHPGADREALTEARHTLIAVINDAINESLTQYLKMERLTAAGRARDLERAMAELGELERQRGELMRQALHDLGGNVQSVTTAATLLSHASLPAEERQKISAVIKHGVHSLRAMLAELMSLARLEAGEETANLATFDAAALLTELCAVCQSGAIERGLFLETQGPANFPVVGDAEKLRRIGQNLVLNALRYTGRGGVTVTWGGEGANHWWISVRDTGPGLAAGGASPMLEGLQQATEDDGERVAKSQEISAEAVPEQPGEGIGLAIVKRLCDLLDAHLSVTSSAAGTTFRVLLPRTGKS